ncbi:MAG: ABC transporter permease [Bacteroidales bacterium]|nr:ABC transporter permease [Bacteroidales bacterium]MCM1416934.1 ABC transporter permease [bacterium]MCM1424627.1 ABC transporter permease [bacterium]
MMSALRKTITAERIKLRRSPVWLAFFCLPLISAFFGTNNYRMNQGVLKNEWFSLWTQHSLFLCFLFMPALIGTYCSYLWRLEHQRCNRNAFLTAPVSRFALYFGKLFQGVLMTILGNVWVFFLYFVCGKLCGLDSPLPREALSWFLCGALGGVVVCSIQLLLSLSIRSFAVPIGIALAGSVGGLAITNKGLGLFYPYSLYAIGMRANNPFMELDVGQFLSGCIAYILLCGILSVWKLKQGEK